MPRKHAALRTVATTILYLSALAAATAGEPANDAKPGDGPIDAYLAREANRLAERVLDGARSRAEWDARRPRLRQELLDMLGLWPLPERTPLQATVTATVERAGGVVVEKLHFQSRPGLYVTGNLYRPQDTDAQRPAVLYVCGHTARDRDGNKTAFQDHGMWFARHGYVCLIIDTLQLGEVAGVHHGTYNGGRWWWQAAGYTPAGVECWNGVRAIDYLAARPDVAPDKIAVTGISGGGAATIWIAAADERVACAVAVSGMSDLESYVAHKVINGHCDCMLCYNFYGWDWTTIAALIAPRPLLFANSDHDRGFPMDANRRIIERLRKLYGLYDRPDLVAEHISAGGHDYRPDLRVAAFGWINRHLKHDSGAVEDARDEPIDGKALRVFPEDKDLPVDARNAVIDESFVPVARPALPTDAADFRAWKQALLEQLRARPFRAFPERIPAAQPVVVDKVIRALTTEPGIEVPIHGVLARKVPAHGGLLIVLNPGDNLTAVPRWVSELAADTELYLLAPRGVGPTEWSHTSPPNYVERAHALVGRTVDEGRVWDIAAAARYLAVERGGGAWRVAGAREAGVLAAYAALFEPTISGVVVVDPPASHREGPIFLSVLRVLDVPDALGLLAPRPLTLLNAGAPFDRTAQIYQAAGAASSLSRSATPP